LAASPTGWAIAETDHIQKAKSAMRQINFLMSRSLAASTPQGQGEEDRENLRTDRPH